MIRLLAVIGFFAGFLLISASLRDSVFGGLASAAGYVQSYSPYSYVLIGLVAIVGITRTLMTGQTAR